jgi:integrase
MKGTIAFEKDRGTFVVWWYVPAKKRSIPLRHYYGIKLYDRELAEKLLALIQGTYEKAKRGECVFRIENFQKGCSVDVVELFESWLKTKRKLKPGGLATYTSHFETWIKPFFLSYQIGLHEITLDVLHKLKISIEDHRRSPKMVKNVMDTMRAFLTYAWRNGNIASVPPLPLKSEYGIGQREIPTIPRKVQFEIIRGIPKIHRPIFYWLVLHPGRRPGEAMALHKEDYNRFKNSFIIKRTISDRKLVEFPKNYQCHEAVCHESFKPFIDDLMLTTSPYLFVNPLARRDGKRYGDNTLNRLWRDACKIYGVKISLYNGVKHSTLDYFYNDLHVSLTDLMDLTGHKNLDCIKHYARMKISRQKSLLELEKDAPYLQLIKGGKNRDSHQIVTKAKNE